MFSICAIAFFDRYLISILNYLTVIVNVVVVSPPFRSLAFNMTVLVPSPSGVKE